MLTQITEVTPTTLRIEKEAGEQFTGDEFRLLNQAQAYEILRITISFGDATVDKDWSVGIADTNTLGINYLIASGSTERQYVNFNSIFMGVHEWLSIITQSSESAMVAEVICRIVSQKT